MDRGGQVASIRVEGILGHMLVAAEWRDGVVTGNQILLTGLQLHYDEGGRRIYDDPLAFAAAVTRIVERYSETPVRITSEGIDDLLLEGMAGLSAA